MISSGVALASHGELRFNLIGFLVQAAAVGVRTFFYFFSPFRLFRIDSITTVRSFASRNDSNPLTRSQDGPTCLAPLLRARLRPH